MLRFADFLVSGLSFEEAVWKFLDSCSNEEEVLKHLEWMLSGGFSVFVDDDGKELLIQTRQRADSFQGFTFYVNAKDHNPPHFHVRHPNCKASFLISDGSLYVGEMGRFEHIVQYWYRNGGKKKVEDLWLKLDPPNN